MRRKGLITALWLLSLFVSSCRQERMPSPDGSSVNFSASSGFFQPTKTEYAGGYVSNGNYERINWLPGDGLTVLSPQAVLYNRSTNPWTEYYTATDPRYSVAHYTVSGSVTPDGIYSTAGVAPFDDKDLHWGVGAHLFFGVYPRLSALPSSVQSYVGIETDATRTKGIIDAYIPKDQLPRSSNPSKAAGTSVRNSSVDSTYIYPQMEYAWMWSAQYAPVAEEDVKLLFSPMVTTFQIAVTGTGEEDVELTRFEMVSESDALQGPFTATVWVDGNNTVITRENVRTKMKCDLEVDNPSAGENMKVTFTFPSGTKVSGSKKVTLTVFVYPKGWNSSTISELTISFVSPGVTRSLKLKDSSGNWVNFPAGRKINIDGLTLPSQDNPWHFSVIGDDWEEEISDVVISPVQVVEIENQEGGELDDKAYVLDVDWDNLLLDEAGGAKSDFAIVKSYKDNAEKTPVPYQLEYYDGTAWQPWGSGSPAWLTIPTPTSFWGGTSAGENLALTMNVLPSTADDPHRTILQNTAWSIHVPKDLSLYNVATGEEVERTTANCYVIKGYGEYRFPLVYGNALKGGAENSDAYFQNLVNDSSFLRYFKDHLDQDITTPYIGTQHSGKEMVPVLIWSDVPGLVQDLQISGIGNGAYMNFRVYKETIAQGNAIVGVLVDGKLAWSWHIWVTDQDLTVGNKASQYMGSNGYVFSPVNLGWCDPVTKSYKARSCSLRVVQPASGLMSEVAVIKQLEQDKTYVYTGSNTYYQWGRKDPMPRFGVVRNNTLANERTLYDSSSANYAMQYKVSPGVSIGTAIQHPNIHYHQSSNMSWSSQRWFNLWNANLTAHSQTSADMIKTIYDPCPVGYMVPPQAAWSDFDSSNCSKTGSEYNSGYGFTYSSGESSVFFPAIGRLSYGGSELYQNICQSVFYWTSVPTANGSYYLSWGGSNVDTSQNQYDSYGFAVRPVMDEVITVAEAADGCFAVSILQEQFSHAGGTSYFEVCSSAFTESNGYYSSCAPGLPWHIAGFSTDRTTWSSTPPSWFSVSRMSGRPSADEDVQFSFTVASAPAGTQRFVLVKFVQESTGQAIVFYITQGSTAGASSWTTNMMFGSDNSICGSGNVILGSGNFIMGYDNRSEGTGNVSVGYENQSIGNNNYSIGVGNSNRGTGNTCVGSYNTCWGSYNICGSSWRYEYEKYVIGDANWVYWFGN